ncbi:MAG: ABC transporter permease [Alphaproteobacteria bacterium]|nr:ABC transporter permease [Alphaproteobacteria bacterium]
MIRTSDLFWSAVNAITAHPMRSSLTSLGVLIGVAAVIAITSVGLGAQSSVTSAISGLGSNLLIVTSGAARGGGVRLASGTGSPLTETDLQALARNLDATVSGSVRGQAQVVAEGTNWNTQIEGVTANYLVTRDLKIAEGRDFEDSEIVSRRKVVILGATVTKELFGSADPIGQRVRISNTPFEVIGVLAKRGQAGFGMDQDDIVLAPIGPVRSRVVGRRLRSSAVSQIFIKASSSDALEALESDAKEILRETRRVREGSEDNFSVQNMASILEAGRSATQTFTLLLGAVAAVSLLVGGIGIMNIMLVAVTERTREIGLRKAIGARSRDILVQFTLEAVLVSSLGGFWGLLVGISGAWALAQFGGWPTTIPVWAAPVSLLFSSVVGVIFGALPAWRAAQLHPVEALRRD